MESIVSIPVFNTRQQALIVVTGLTTVIVMGVSACIALVLALMWLIVRLALIVVQAFIETLSTIGATYTAADPLIKFCMLACIAYVLYCLYRKITASKGRQL